jgi:hypothetical protein
VVSMMARNFEVPVDAGANNVYDYILTAADAANNTASKAVAVTVTDMTGELGGQAIIDLTATGQGKLILPVQVEGKWYYYWDKNNSGDSDNGPDIFTHTELNQIFNKDINGGINPTAGTPTTETYRYGTLNGVRVALPTDNGGATYPLPFGNFQPPTIYTDAGVNSNGTTGIYNELNAIWDAYNGNGTEGRPRGVPLGWSSGAESASFWSATPDAGAGWRFVDLGSGGSGTNWVGGAGYVGVQGF